MNWEYLSERFIEKLRIMKSRDKRNIRFLRSKVMKYFLSVILFCTSCTVSFRGISIPPEVKTVYVDTFINDPGSDYNIPSLGQDVSETLLEKVLKETNLQQNDEQPDIEFSGTVRVKISSEAPQAGQASSLDRMEVIVSVEYTSHLDEENNWKQSFSNFENFDPSENLDAIQEDLVENILENIMEDIYQKAFTNW